MPLPEYCGEFMGKVGSFCCPVLPVPLESDSVARFGPTALFQSNFRP